MAEPRPLLVTNDPELLDDLLRLAAAADVEVDVAADPIAARVRWDVASLVLLGADLADAAGVKESPPRVGVLLVGRGDPSDEPAPADRLGRIPILWLPAAEEQVIDHMVRSTGPPSPPARVIGVVGGCGGAGASVLAAALAMTAARSRQPAMLVDLDRLGGGLDLLLGIEEVPGVRWADLVEASGPIAPMALREQLPARDGVAVLSHGRHVEPDLRYDAVCATVAAGRRGGGVVVLDLSRYPSFAAAELELADEVVLVVPADLRAAASAVRVAARLTGSSRTGGLVVRRLAASSLSPAAIAEVVPLPLLADARPEPGLPALLASGRPLRVRRRGPLASLCDRLLEQPERNEERAA